MADKKKVNPGNSSDSREDDTSPAAKKATARKTSAKAKSASTEEKVEAVARKAKSTAKKVAAAVTGRVKEIAGKMGKTTKTGSKSSGSGAISKATGGSQASKIGVSDRTKVGALAGDVTSEDVNAGLAGTVSSGDIRPEQDIEDEAATDVKEHYFHDQHVHAGPPPPQPPRDVPDEYGDTKLVLLIRDPEWAYAYWEINDETRNQLNIPRNGHPYRQVLRIFKITGRQWPEEAAHYFFDVDVSNDAQSWYIHMPEADEAWCAELGIIDDEENFIPICRSNPIQTPRNSISEHVDSEWMVVEESFEKITRLSSAALDAQLRGESYAGSESILRHIQRQLTGVLHGERAALSSGIFSSESTVAMQDKNFWLQVHTELILYGATEPDARVTVQGQPVVLNPDGTFSVRFALPDGEQVLEVRARNADGDLEESVTPVVLRTTR
jgi:hypothetical protein